MTNYRVIARVATSAGWLLPGLAAAAAAPACDVHGQAFKIGIIGDEIVLKDGTNLPPSSCASVVLCHHSVARAAHLAHQAHSTNPKTRHR